MQLESAGITAKTSYKYLFIHSHSVVIYRQLNDYEMIFMTFGKIMDIHNFYLLFVIPADSNCIGQV